jgi:hypothetical protein
MTITIDEEMVGGEMLGAARGHVRAYPPGRVCAAEGCTTVLSVYNGRARCAAHDFHDFHAELGRLSRHPSAPHRATLLSGPRRAA